MDWMRRRKKLSFLDEEGKNVDEGQMWRGKRMEEGLSIKIY